MGQSYISNMPSFKLTLTTIKLRVVPHKKFCFKRYYEYSLPDASYGEFIILQEAKPKFLFKVFNEKGEITRFAKYLSSLKGEYDKSLIKVLKKQGYTNLRASRSSIFSIRFDDKSTLKDFEVYRIDEE